MRMFISEACALSLLVAGPVIVSAETPNVNPGQWEYQATMTMSAGGQAMPARTMKNKDCVRQEDVSDPDLFGTGRFALHDVGGSQAPGRHHGGHHAR